MKGRSINEQVTRMGSWGSSLLGPPGRWCGTHFRVVPPEDNGTGMFTLLLLPVTVWRLLSRALSPWHFLCAPRVGWEKSLSWTVAGVRSSMLLAYNEAVNAHGTGCVWGLGRRWERTVAFATPPLTSLSRKNTLTICFLELIFEQCFLCSPSTVVHFIHGIIGCVFGLHWLTELLVLHTHRYHVGSLK